MTDFSQPTDQSPVDDNHMGDASAPVSGDDVASDVESSDVAVSRQPYDGPVSLVVVQPGDTWDALATFYKTDIATLMELNPNVPFGEGTISGIVSEFRVPFTRLSR